MEAKKRQANYELLRIISMMMVITLHYIIKGNVVSKLSVDGSFINNVWWFIETMANVAVNVYVLMSGYFLVDSKWRVSKLVKLVCQVLFYSILVGLVVYLLLDVLKVPAIVEIFSVAGAGSEFDLSTWLYMFLPIEYEHYWFATAYIIMYMLSPVLAIAVKELPKKQLATVIIALLCFFCIPKSINPYLIPTDAYGYDFGWFICLFLIAGYIKMHGLPVCVSKADSAVWYLLGVFLNWAVCSFSGLIARTTGKLEYYMDMTHSYNYILVLLTSIAFFMIWRYVEIPEGKFSDLVCKIAPLTFGVYLFHENITLRLVWPYMLGIHKVENFFLKFLHMIVSIIIVFTLGCIIDLIRIKIFNSVEKKFVKKEE